jgi:hypothetical protein
MHLNSAFIQLERVPALEASDWTIPSESRMPRTKCVCRSYCDTVCVAFLLFVKQLPHLYPELNISKSVSRLQESVAGILKLS